MTEALLFSSHVLTVMTDMTGGGLVVPDAVWPRDSILRWPLATHDNVHGKPAQSAEAMEFAGLDDRAKKKAGRNSHRPS
jgi:hypothetical protein